MYRCVLLSVCLLSGMAMAVGQISCGDVVDMGSYCAVECGNSTIYKFDCTALGPNCQCRNSAGEIEQIGDGVFTDLDLPAVSDGAAGGGETSPSAADTASPSSDDDDDDDDSYDYSGGATGDDPAAQAFESISSSSVGDEDTSLSTFIGDKEMNSTTSGGLASAWKDTVAAFVLIATMAV